MLGPVRTIICEVCNQPFEAQRSHRKICSDVCRRKRQAENKKKWYVKDAEKTGRVSVGGTRNCIVCSASFIVTSGRKKICSPECVSERNRISANASYWRRPENAGREIFQVKKLTDEEKKYNATNSRLIAAYGITIRERDEMIAAQDGKCKICSVEFDLVKKRGHRTPHIDHCHSRGVVRGVLCHDCNVGLGSFRDSKSNLMNAVAYLSFSERKGDQ